MGWNQQATKEQLGKIAASMFNALKNYPNGMVLPRMGKVCLYDERMNPLAAWEKSILKELIFKKYIDHEPRDGKFIFL